MLMLSGPVQLLVLEFLMAPAVCCSVMGISSEGSFFVMQSMILLFGWVCA